MRKELIDLYARFEASSVTSQAEYEALSDKDKTNKEFLWLRQQLETMKTIIETHIQPGMSQRDQLREAINMLRGYRDEAQAPNRDLFYELLVAIYGPSWSPERKAYFEKALTTVKLPRDYFLSFTTRHHRGTV